MNRRDEVPRELTTLNHRRQTKSSRQLRPVLGGALSSCGGEVTLYNSPDGSLRHGLAVASSDVPRTVDVQLVFRYTPGSPNYKAIPQLLHGGRTVNGVEMNRRSRIMTGMVKPKRSKSEAAVRRTVSTVDWIQE